MLDSSCGWHLLQLVTSLTDRSTSITGLALAPDTHPGHPVLPHLSPGHTLCLRHPGPELQAGAPRALSLKPRRLHPPLLCSAQVLLQPLLCPEVPAPSGLCGFCSSLPQKPRASSRAQGSHQPGQFAGSFTVQSHGDPVHQQLCAQPQAGQLLLCHLLLCQDCPGLAQAPGRAGVSRGH